MLYCVALYVVSFDHVYILILHDIVHVHVQFNSALSAVSDRAEGPVRAATPATPKGVYTCTCTCTMYMLQHRACTMYFTSKRGLKKKKTVPYTHTQSKRVGHLYKCIYYTCTTSFGYMNFHYTACEVNLLVIHLHIHVHVYTCTCTMYMYMYLLSHFLSPYRKLKYVAMSLVPRARR